MTHMTVTVRKLVGANSESGIRFTLNNYHEAQDSYEVRNITAEMSHAPIVLHEMQKHTPESNATHEDTIDRKIRPFRSNMT